MSSILVKSASVCAFVCFCLCLCYLDGESHLILLLSFLLLLLLLKEVRNARTAESGLRSIPCQSKESSPTIPTYRKKEEKGKKVEYKKGSEQLRLIKRHLLCS